MLRQALLALSAGERVQRLAFSPLARGVVERHVPGDVAAVVDGLARRGLLVSAEHLGGEVTDRAQAERAVGDHLALLDLLPAGAEASVSLTALGLRLSEELALDNAAVVCQAAESRGVTVTLEAAEHDAVRGLYGVHATLRKEHPDVGVVVHAHLPGAEERCERLDGARVRLSKGGHPAPGALTAPADVDRSYARCLRTLMAGGAYPMVATHDPRLLRIAGTLAVLHGREPSGFEYQLRHGLRTDEQERLAEQGAQVRVRVPCGPGWYVQLTRRLADRPRDLALVARALLSRGRPPVARARPARP
ncbi:proline dehydrogenase family protein [Nonomuraea pusilla]|uniref:L-proline dehydrogenase n=1 Tax=Nonomuraea pusilla TaxID=46177 RepID=A0A1H7QZK3_9ACTN|nr:proline dehydrogenase family protein [Nonomuraea pusilla]SEL52727.1 L-proline dehydrogenase [Nonomuraea pusilla]